MCAVVNSDGLRDSGVTGLQLGNKTSVVSKPIEEGNTKFPSVLPIRLPSAEVHRMRPKLCEIILHNINYTNFCRSQTIVKAP